MPSLEHRQETFRPLHDVLEETAQVLDASQVGLTRVADKDDLSQRERMMLRALIAERAKAGRTVCSVMDAAPPSCENVWLQFAPIFAASPRLAECIAATASTAEACATVDDSDEALAATLRSIAETRPAASSLLDQIAALIEQMRRSSRGVILGANDM